MRVHSNVLTTIDIRTAAIHTGVVVHDLAVHASRSRKRSFSFHLEGSGVYGGQWGNSEVKSATWDEWGILIGRLYTRDPDAHWGKNSYQDAEHFHWQTGNRFRTLDPSEQHIRHRWESQGLAVGGRYAVAHCTQCTAIHRWLMPGVTWQEFQAVTA